VADPASTSLPLVDPVGRSLSTVDLAWRSLVDHHGGERGPDVVARPQRAAVDLGLVWATAFFFFLFFY